MIYQIQCSWCGNSMGIKEMPANNMTLTTSHGICNECKNKVLESIKFQTININYNQTENNKEK